MIIQSLHQSPRPLIRLSTELGKSSQQKQATETWATLRVKFDSILIKLYVCDEKPAVMNHFS